MIVSGSYKDRHLQIKFKVDPDQISWIMKFSNELQSSHRNSLKNYGNRILNWFFLSGHTAHFSILYHMSRMIWCLWYVINGILYSIVSNWFPLGENFQRPKEYLKYQQKFYSAIFTHIFLFISIVRFIDLFQTHFCHFGFNQNYEQSMNLTFLIEPYLSDHSSMRLCVYDHIIWSI